MDPFLSLQDFHEHFLQGRPGGCLSMGFCLSENVLILPLIGRKVWLEEGFLVDEFSL